MAEQAIHDSKSIRYEIYSAWASTGELPCEVPEAIANTAAATTSSAIANVTHVDCGIFIVHVSAASGVKSGSIEITAVPYQDDVGEKIQWQCRSKAFPSVEQYGACKTNRLRTVAGSDKHRDFPKYTDPVTKTADLQTHVCNENQHVQQALFTTDVWEDYAGLQLEKIGRQRELIYFYTQLASLTNRSIRHVWFHNDQQFAEFSFDVTNSVQPIWSRQNLLDKAPGIVRVDVKEGNCLLTSHSVEITDQPDIDPARQGGWMRPTKAFATMLARDNAKSPASILVTEDLRPDPSDPPIIKAILNNDAARALEILEENGPLGKDSHKSGRRYVPYSERTDPFTKDSQGRSALQLATVLGMHDVVNRLIRESTRVRPRKNPSTKFRVWHDSSIALSTGNERFEDGDSVLLRAVRTNNERAVATLLRVGTWDPADSWSEPKASPYQFDASGKLPWRIANENGFHGVKWLLEKARESQYPKWAQLRATFTTGLEQQKPANCRKASLQDEPEIHFYSEIADMKGQHVAHIWIFEDKEISRQEFEVDSDLYVAISSRTFTPSDIGRWHVNTVVIPDERFGLPKSIRIGQKQLSYLALDKNTRTGRNNYTVSDCSSLGLSAAFHYVDAGAPVARLNYLSGNGLDLGRYPQQANKLFRQAITDSHLQHVDWFLAQGFGLQDSVTHKKTPVMLAASKGNAPLLMLLLNRGADPDYVHEYNVPQPALHYAVRENQIRATKVLLTHGANPNIKTAKGVTPFETAVKLCHFDIASLLIKNGAIAISQKFNTNALTEILDRCKRSHFEIEQSDSYNNFLQVYSNTQSQDSLEDKK